MNKVFREAYSNWKAYAAEFLGTFVFVFVSLGTVLSNVFFGEVGVVGIALSAGLVYSSMVFATVHISGGHLNPAITFSLWFSRKITTATAVLYMFFQVLAGFAAAAVLLAVFGLQALEYSLGTQVIGGGVSLQTALVVEVILSAVLIFAFFATMVDRRGPLSFGPLVLGFVVSSSILVAGSITGGLINPAKAIGANVISGTYLNLIVWVIGPFVGSLFGPVYEVLFLRKKSKR